MCKTKVINIYAGPGKGKSTTAAMLYAYLKNMCIECELSREYIKKWVWQGRKITNMDQYYILGRQMYGEEILFNRVPYIICDSPIMQANYYLHKNREDLTLDSLGPLDPAIFDFMSEAGKLGVEFYHFFVEKNGPYMGSGRYQTEEEAERDHQDLYKFLIQPERASRIKLHVIKGDKEERVKNIADIILNK